MQSKIVKGDVDHITYREKVKEWAEKYNNKIAIIDEDIEMTYSEMYQKVRILASNFYERGINYNDKVIMQFSNTYVYIITLLSVLYIGAEPVLVLPAHREKDISKIVEKCNAKVYLCSRNYGDFNYEKLANNIKANSTIEDIIFDDEIINILNTKNENKNLDSKLHNISYKDTALYILSGGTTGVPKLIPRTHGDYIYNGRICGKRCRLTNQDKYLAVLPAAHNFALNNPGIFGTFEYGGTNVLCLYASPLEILELIDKYKITNTSLVPALGISCAEYIKSDSSFDLSSLKFVAIGGAALNPVAAKKIKDGFKCQLVQVFGTGEGLICTTSLDDDDDVVLNCQGKPISEYDEIKIVDENYKEVKQGEAGELINKGLYTIKGYYMNEEANKKSFTKDGYYCTGDVACITKEGNLKVIGRIKEQINRAGEKIMPSEIEGYINKYKGVIDSVLLGIEDDLLGFSTCICIMSENKNITLDEIKKYMKEIGVALYKIPDKLMLFDSFPLTAVNKINRNKLHDMVLERLSR